MTRPYYAQTCKKRNKTYPRIDEDNLHPYSGEREEQFYFPPLLSGFDNDLVLVGRTAAVANLKPFICCAGLHKTKCEVK